MLASLRLTFGPDGIVAHGDAELEVDHGVALVVDAPCNLTHLLPSVTEPLEYFSALKRQIWNEVAPVHYFLLQMKFKFKFLLYIQSKLLFFYITFNFSAIDFQDWFLNCLHTLIWARDEQKSRVEDPNPVTFSFACRIWYFFHRIRILPITTDI